MLKRILFIFLLFAYSNAFSSEQKNNVNQFLDKYVKFHDTPKVEMILNYFKPDTKITYFDNSLEKDNICKTGCDSDINQLRVFLKKIENGEKHYLMNRIDRKIDFETLDFEAIVTTNIIEKEVTKEKMVLSKIDVIEKLYIKKIKNKLIITKVEIILDSSKEQKF